MSTPTLRQALAVYLQTGGGGRWHIGPVGIYQDPNDWWIGYYRGKEHHYVCPLPTLVLRWRRRQY